MEVTVNYFTWSGTIESRVVSVERTDPASLTALIDQYEPVESIYLGSYRLYQGISRPEDFEPTAED